MDSLGCFGIRKSDKFILHFNQVCFQIYRMYCIVDSKDNKVDKTREEADMTFSPFFSKSVQSGPKVIQKMGNGQKHLKNIDLDHSRTLLNTFGPLLKILEKNWAKGHPPWAPSLVLSSLLSLPTTVPLTTNSQDENINNSHVGKWGIQG